MLQLTLHVVPHQIHNSYFNEQNIVQLADTLNL